MSSFDNPIETIQLDEREKRKLIEALKQPKPAHEGARRGIRVPYNSSFVTVSITNPGGNVVKYSVIPRNLSRQGIAFLHGRFIYPDSKCSITLQTLDDENMTMDGVIVRCNHLAGMIHEVAAVFNSPIDLTLFANLTPSEEESHTEEYENDVSSGKIERGPSEMGTILLVDSYTLDRRLYGAFLDRGGYLCRDAANMQDAIEVLDRYQVDAAVIDVCCEPEYGIALISQLVVAGFSGPILAISVEDDEHVQQTAISAGAHRFISKPVASETFIAQINQLVGNGVAADGRGPIVSTFGQDEWMRHLLREFINDSRETVNTLRSAAFTSDEAQIRQICRQLKGAGGGYGFEEVSQSASEVIMALENMAGDVQAQQVAVDSLLNVLGRIRASE